MTICVAWRDGAHVFLVADTALTALGPGATRPRTISSTFGEVHEEGELRVEESGAKLVRLGEGVAAAYSGESGTAVSAMIQIRNWLRYGDSLRDVMRRIRGHGKGGDFQLLVAGGPSDDPQLYVLNSDGSWREIAADREPVVLGSLPPEGKGFVRRAVVEPYKMPDFSSEPDRILAAALMALQALGQRVNLMQDRAGGAFFGMRISEGRVHPQRDIRYALFSKDELSPEGFEQTLVGVRRNLLVSRSATQGMSVFVTDVNDVDDEQIREMLDAEPLGFEKVPGFFCFIERRVGAIVGVDCRDRVPSRYVEITSAGDEVTMRLLPALLETIAEVPNGETGLPAEVPHIFVEEPPDPQGE